MPRPRFEKLDSAKKETLLDAATREFAERGYELASVNRILEAAGMSKGLLYYYFDDKADLAATVFLAVAGPAAQLGEVRAVESAEAFWVELRRVSMEQLRVLESRRVAYECAIRLSNALLTTPEFAQRVLPQLAPARQAMAKFLEQGVALGALRSDLPLPTVMGLIEAVKTAAYKAAFPTDRVPTEDEMQSFADLVIDLAQRIAAPKKG